MNIQEYLIKPKQLGAALAVSSCNKAIVLFEDECAIVVSQDIDGDYCLSYIENDMIKEETCTSYYPGINEIFRVGFSRSIQTVDKIWIAL